MDFIVGEKQSDAAATLVSAAAGTLAVQLLAGETPGSNFGQSMVTFGGAVALSEAVGDLICPRVKKLIGAQGEMEVTAIRAATAFGVSYGVFMLAGVPSVTAAAGATIGVVAGEYVYGMLTSRPQATAPAPKPPVAKSMGVGPVVGGKY